MGTITVVSATSYTELAKRTNGGKALPIAQNLTKRNDYMADALVREANNPGFHKHSRTLSKPSGQWRGHDEGVDPGSAQTQIIDEPIARLEHLNQIDEATMDMFAPDVQVAHRRGEDLIALSGLADTVNVGALYGVGGGQPLGLFSRHFDPVGDAGSVLDNGATSGLCTSILVLQWGDEGFYHVFPQGSKALGVKVKDKGLEAVWKAGKKYYAWTTQMVAMLGLCERDTRAVQRIRRIKVGADKAGGGVNDDLIVRALGRLPGLGRDPGTRIYVSRDVKIQMDLLAKNQSNINYRPGEYGGQPATYFQGVLVRIQEGISEAESAVLTSPF